MRSLAKDSVRFPKPKGKSVEELCEILKKRTDGEEAIKQAQKEKKI